MKSSSLRYSKRTATVSGKGALASSKEKLIPSESLKIGKSVAKTMTFDFGELQKIRSNPKIKKIQRTRYTIKKIRKTMGSKVRKLCFSV